MASEAKFKTFYLAGIDFRQLTPLRRQEIIQRVVDVSQASRWWEDADRKRYSLVKCDSIGDDRAVGVITQQYDLEQHVYADNKSERRDDLESFEDRLFVIDASSQQLTLEWRQFRNKPPLSLSVLPIRVERMLSEMISEVLQGTTIELLPYEKRTTKAEFISLFYANRSIELDAAKVGAFPVASDVQLVNPNADLEGAARELFEHDFQKNSVDQLALRARETSTQDLRRSAIARTAIHSGYPTRLRFVREDRLVHALIDRLLVGRQLSFLTSCGNDRVGNGEGASRGLPSRGEVKRVRRKSAQRNPLPSLRAYVAHGR
jgi:hypothetical protein